MHILVIKTNLKKKCCVFLGVVDVVEFIEKQFIEIVRSPLLFILQLRIR